MSNSKKEYFEHLKGKGYKILSEDQVQSQGYVFNVITDMRELHKGVVSTYYLKLAK